MAKTKQTYILKVVSEGLKEVTQEIKNLNSNLSGANQAVDENGKSLDKAGKKQDAYLRGLKATGGGTNNATKGFSKMAQNLNGTLVPAYATVAANVFALTAAFGALKRAADLQILLDSADTLAVQTGRSLKTLSEGMKDITNSAITMKEAMESASIASSAGFDNSTIKDLTQVARNASVALGRDMTDSLNRVFKGAIKAEPELLDELGIILRLDTASRNYAAALGKTANSLTTFEKQQAVVNAVIEQGTDKFAEFENVDVNPYTQLATAFQDVSASLIQLISIPVAPMLSFFSENLTALTAVLILFSTSVLKRAFPALGNFTEEMENRFASATEKAAEALTKAKDANFSYTKSLVGTTKESTKLLSDFSKGVEGFRETIEDTGKVGKNFKEAFTLGTDSVDGLKAYKKGLQQVVRTLNAGAKVSQGFKPVDVPALKEEIGEVENVLKKFKTEVVTIDKQLKLTSNNAVVAFTRMKLSVVSFGAELSKGATRGALAGYTKGFSGIKEVLADITTQELPRFTKASKYAVAGISGLGGAFLKVIPIIGQLTVAWSLLSTGFSFIKDTLFDKPLVDLTKTLEDNTEALETAAKSAKFYNDRLKELPDTITNIDKKAKLLSNTFGNLSESLENTLNDIRIDEGFGGLDSFLDAFGLGNLDEFKDQLDSITKTMRAFGNEKEANDIIADFGKLLRLSGEEAENAGEMLLKHLQAIRDNNRGQLELNNLLRESLDGVNKGLTQLNDGLPALNGTEKAFFQLGTTLRSLDTSNVELIASTVEELNSVSLTQLGLSDIAKTISQIKVPLKDLRSELNKTQGELDKVNQRRAEAAKLGQGQLAFVTRATAEEFTSLTQLVDTYQAGIESLTTSLSEQAVKIVPQLEEIHKRFELIIDAQRKIADIRAQEKVANLEQGRGLESRLDQLDKITKAENQYINTITEQTEISLNKLEEKIKKTSANLVKARGTKEEASVIKSLESLEIARQRNVNKLLENRNKIVENYIKQVQATQKELVKTTKYVAAGLTVSEAQTKLIKDDLYNAYLNIGIAQKKADPAKFAEKMTTAAIQAEKFKAAMQQARMPSVDAVISDTSGMTGRIEAMDIESDYLDTTGNLLSERIDKELYISKIINDRQIAIAEAAFLEAETGSDAEYRAMLLIEALQLKGLKITETQGKLVRKLSKEKLKGLKDETKYSASILKLGLTATKAERDKIKFEKIKNKLTEAGYDNAKELTKEMEKQAKIDFAQKFNDGIAEMIEGMSDFSSIMSNLYNEMDNDKIDDATAGMKALSNIAAVSGDNVMKAFADMALITQKYNEKLDAGSMTARDWSNYTMSALGAMSQMYEEGSSQAKTLQALQQVLAITNAVASIANSATSGDPYTAPARVAHMLALMSGVLGLAGIGLGGSADVDTSAADAYKETIGSQGLVGVELDSNALVESINDMVDSNTALFSIQHKLQVAITSLGDMFELLAVSMIRSVEGISDAELMSKYGINPGTVKMPGEGTYGGIGFLDDLVDMDPILSNLLSPVKDLLDATGFSSRKVSTTVIDSGIQFGATLQAVGNQLVGDINSASAYLVAQYHVVEKKWWGLSKSSSTYLRTYYDSLPTMFEAELAYALDKTLNVITDVFRTFGSAVSVDLATLFSDIGTIDINTLRISLRGKSAEAQSEALAAWFTNMGNDIIATTIPFIEDYALVNEELLDTLIRITNNTLKLSSAFSTLGLDIAVIADVDTINFSTMTDAAAEAMKLEMVAAWQKSFLDNFKDFEEFTELFDKFSQAIYSETELLDFAFINATNVVDEGFAVLREGLEERGDVDLLAALGPDNTSEALRALYELGVETNAFAAIIDETTGEIDTSGADLLTILIQLGAALDDQSNAAEQLEDALDNLNEQYERQIALFGLVGKELDLLNLEFDFQDAIREAEETGTDMALVETYYALERLDIYRRYNQEIVDSINSTMAEVSDSILVILQAATGWDEVAYQSIKVSKTVNALVKSLGTIGAGIDFSIFADLNDTTDFLNTLESFIDVTVDSTSDIEGQISLVEDLRDAVMARYEAEVAAAEDLNSTIEDSIARMRDLSGEINNFLNELFIGDLSPLTNAERLAEAQSQFDENVQNVLSDDLEKSEAASENLLSSATALLELANQFWAIGPEYEAVFNSVVASLEGIDSNLLTEIAASEETLAINSLEESLTALQVQTIEQLQTLDEILVALESANAASLEAEIASYSPEIIANLGAITDKLDEINNDSWAPIVTQLEILNSTLGTMNSFAKGSEEISYDQVAMIHKGETILTADTSNAIRNGESIYGTEDALVANATTSSGDNADVVDAIRILTQVVSSGQEDLIEKNEEVRQATRSISIDINGANTSSTKGIV